MKKMIWFIIVVSLVWAVIMGGLVFPAIFGANAIYVSFISGGIVGGISYIYASNRWDK